MTAFDFKPVPTTSPITFLVAANDAAIKTKQKADYVCDGIDDQVQIQNAINALPSFGGYVYLSEGNFSISSDILPNDSVTLYSDGNATLELVNGATTQNVISITGKSNVRVYGLIIDGNGSNVGDLDNTEYERNGIVVNNSTDVYIQNNIVLNCFQNGIYIIKDSSHILVSGNIIKNNNTGILCYNLDINGSGNGATNVTIIGNLIDGNDVFANTPQVGIYFSGGTTYCQAIGNIVTNGYDAFHINGTNGTEHNSILNNIIRGHSNSAVWITTAAHNHIVRGNIIEHNIVGSNRAIYATTSGGGSDRLVIDGNSIFGSIGNAIDLSVSDYSQIINNKIFTCSGSGLLINGGQYNRIAANHFEDCGNSGITISSGNDNQAIGNTAVNNTGAGIFLGAGITGTLIAHNYFDGNSLYGVNYRAGNFYHNNNGFTSENSGTDTITNGTTSVVITHGLSITPTIDDIRITLAENPTNDPGNIWVDTITATQFTVNCRNDPGASNLDFGWQAIIL